jgi:hypothetical protein
VTARFKYGANSMKLFKPRVAVGLSGLIRHFRLPRLLGGCGFKFTGRVEAGSYLF